MKLKFQAMKCIGQIYIGYMCDNTTIRPLRNRIGGPVLFREGVVGTLQKSNTAASVQQSGNDIFC